MPANYNCPGQIVISGDPAGGGSRHGAREARRRQGEAAQRQRGVPLAAHGAAVAGLATALDLAHFADARFPIYANVSAQPVKDAALARRLLLEQLTAPVQWTRASSRSRVLHPDAPFVEMGPGAVLKGLVKKIVPDATVAELRHRRRRRCTPRLVNA